MTYDADDLNAVGAVIYEKIGGIFQPRMGVQVSAEIAKSVLDELVKRGWERKHR